MKKTQSKLTTLWVAAGLVITAATLHAEDHGKAKIDASKLPPASTKQGVTYAGDIKAIFEKSCVKCHGEEKPKAKLRLTTLENALKGIEGKNGANEKVIEPGKSVESTLFLSVAKVGDEDHWMPPAKNKANIGPLTADEVGLIRAWIDQGAK